jgi:hypothetical protein
MLWQLKHPDGVNSVLFSRDQLAQIREALALKKTLAATTKDFNEYRVLEEQIGRILHIDAE